MQNTTKKQTRASNFTQIHNDFWSDMNLTGDALRVLGYLLSKPEGWTIRETDIRKQFAPIGKEKASNHFFRKVIKNLQHAGYIKKIAHRNASGHIIRWETLISDEPVFLDINQHVENNHMLKNQHVEKPTCGEFTPLSNKELFSNKELSKNTEFPPPPLPPDSADETKNKKNSPEQNLVNLWLINIDSETIPKGKSLQKDYLYPAKEILEHFGGDLKLASDTLYQKFRDMDDAGFPPHKMKTPVNQIIQDSKRSKRKSRNPKPKSKPLSPAQIALQNAFGQPQ